MFGWLATWYMGKERRYLTAKERNEGTWLRRKGTWESSWSTDRDTLKEFARAPWSSLGTGRLGLGQFRSWELRSPIGNQYGCLLDPVLSDVETTPGPTARSKRMYRLRSSQGSTTQGVYAGSISPSILNPGSRHVWSSYITFSLSPVLCTSPLESEKEPRDAGIKVKFTLIRISGKTIPTRCSVSPALLLDQPRLIPIPTWQWAMPLLDQPN